MTEFREITPNLRFPEGPIAMPDGSVLLVEIAASRLTRVAPDGTLSVVAETGGGPNGAAIGPDGRCYICNNGGMTFHERDGLLLPGHAADDAAAGWIEAVNLDTGKNEVLYRECNGEPLRAPNDIVFDADGGMWFTDHGKSRQHSRDKGSIFYAHTDGSMIRQVVRYMDAPNGIGLSPDGKSLYAAETPTGRLWAYDITAPGEIDKTPGPAPWTRGRLLANPDGYHLFDSLAVDGAGNICIGSIPGAISVISPDGKSCKDIEMPDPFPTNICFGGEDLRTAYITLSGAGRLIAMDWPNPGLPLHFLNR
ncbi:MAG: SMP-30/gluconolactonase/LRE family protein [Alphaproteobacteria bacterium]|nr:SMP-30/gluconolactonase/LRE family protein [Alphaproteobacteria bacterium]